MAGNKRKRQKVETATATAPLGSDSFVPADVEDIEKDDEERELESVLFGTPFVPSIAKSAKAKGKAVQRDDGPTATGLDHVMDEDLFFIDDADPIVDEEDTHSLSLHDAQEDASGDDGASSSSEASSSKEPVAWTAKSGKKAAAWSDPSDAHITVSLAGDKRLRKLRDAPTEDDVNGKTYESKLRRKYQELNPAPEWAQSARNKLHKRPKRRRASSVTSSGASENEEPVAELDDLLRNTDGLVSRGDRPKAVPAGTIAVERLRDANNSAPAEGGITCIKFHPSPAVPVMLATGNDKRMRLFNIDGLTNPLLQTLHTSDLAPTTALFHPSGSTVLLTGTKPFYYTYDLQSNRAVKSARGLWLGAPGSRGEGDFSMEHVKFSPGDGSLLAMGARAGYVHLVDWAAGGGQVVGSLKCHSPVKDIAWVPTSNGQPKQLLTLSQDAEVYLWDVGSRRCMARWKDEGNFGASVLQASPGGSHYAIGSTTGIVNLYGPSAGAVDPNAHTLGVAGSRETRTALKTVTNLTTAITSITFDSTSQIMAIASRAKKDQLRLVHLASQTTFQNWPTSGTPLGTVTCVDFSAGSEYIAIGNTRGKINLYHLRHFAPVY